MSKRQYRLIQRPFHGHGPRHMGLEHGAQIELADDPDKHLRRQQPASIGDIDLFVEGNPAPLEVGVAGVGEGEIQAGGLPQGHGRDRDLADAPLERFHLHRRPFTHGLPDSRRRIDHGVQIGGLRVEVQARGFLQALAQLGQTGLFEGVDDLVTLLVKGRPGLHQLAIAAQPGALFSFMQRPHGRLERNRQLLDDLLPRPALLAVQQIAVTAHEQQQREVIDLGGQRRGRLIPRVDSGAWFSRSVHGLSFLIRLGKRQVIGPWSGG